MKNIKLWRRKTSKKLTTLPLNFTGALWGITKSSGVVVIALKNGIVETYATEIASEDEKPKNCIKAARKILEAKQMSDLILYEWENVGDNFEYLMFVYGGELDPRMSCVK